MTDAENIDSDLCPKCGGKLTYERLDTPIAYDPQDWFKYHIPNIPKFHIYCPNCGWEEGE